MQLSATHIIGGELTYTHVQNDEHLVTLTIYRDCGPGNTNGAGFDATSEIGVFDASGTYLFSEVFNFTTALTVPVQLNIPCLTAPPTICVESSEYSGIIELPPLPGGYILAYQRCCRTPNTLNLQTPNTQGITCTVEVPDPGQGNNSTPTFTDYPPIALCLNYPMVFDHSAIDPDGDQLVYELCDPLTGGAPGAPAPSPPAGPPYAPVIWAAGYSTAMMMNGTPSIAIDAVSGVLTVTPSMLGSFVVGVCVKEFRNGVLMSTVRRDLRFDVVPCVIQVASAVQQQDSLCNGLTVSMNNASQNSSNFFWDFGDTNITTDTSSAFAPTYTYADTGTYEVMLIAEPGGLCADTSYGTFEIYFPLQPTFTAPPILCTDQLPALLEVQGNISSNATADWDLGAFGTPQLISGQQIQADFAQPGSNIVQVDVFEHGCTGTFTDTLTVYPNPTVDFNMNTAGCAPFEVSPTPLTSAWTPLQFEWDLGDGSTSTDSLPFHTYTTPGLYSVSLTVTSTSGCIDTVTMNYIDLVSAFAQPIAGFSATPTNVSVYDPVVQVSDSSVDAGSWVYYVDGQIYTDPDFSHFFTGGGNYIITQIVSSDLNCSDTATVQVMVENMTLYAPNAFTPDGDGDNDVFALSAVGISDVQLSIFDRWGEVVFSSNDLSQGWDGEGFPAGVYVYKITYSLSSAVGQREKIGSVALIR